MFVGNQTTIPTSQAVHFATEAEVGTFQNEADDLTLICCQFLMQAPPSVDGCIGNTDFLDFLQVEEPFTVREGMQGHNTNSGSVHGR